MLERVQRWGKTVFNGFIRSLLRLRYRLDVEGLSTIQASKEKGILFMPNHVAIIDPVIITSLLWPSFEPRPLSLDDYFYQKWLRILMNVIRALPMPNMDFPNQWKAKQIEKIKAKIVEDLKKGDNFLIYPTGKLKRDAEEKVGGASFIYELLKVYPEAKIVLVRITGLWGSLFSRALTGKTPDISKAGNQSVWILIKNLLFFTPRRRVKVEFEWAPPDMPRKGTKEQLSQWLEKWYNRDGPEPLKLVSYAFWRNDLPKITKKETEAVKEVSIPPDQRKEILDMLSNISKRPADQIKPEWHLSNDLGLDSLDVAQLYTFLEERFNTSRLPPGSLQIVNDLFEAAVGMKIDGEYDEVADAKMNVEWPKEEGRRDPVFCSGETIPELFLRMCDVMKGRYVCLDARSGALSYRKFKRTVLVLSLMIEKMPGQQIGILLPSAVGSYATILATLLAGKVPVMLNWTTGPRNLEHAVNSTHLQVVLSSYRFLSRLEVADLGEVDDILTLLEELRSSIPLSIKLKGLFLSFFKADTLLQKLPKARDLAVILFTSGTETLPKGVPLTHQNILSNLRSARSCVNLLSSDILLGVLPPFHSFGFSVTGLFPLLVGVRVCFAPDPTDSKALVKDIENWKATIFACAPSFIISLLHVVKGDELRSLRMVVTGAEKAPDDLFVDFEKRGIRLLEGYGISECSPIVTIDRDDEPHKGVGKPVPNVELCIIDPDTDQLISSEKEGEICVFGPNVFEGYLGTKKDPFIVINGKRWYRTGDRGYIDPSGTLMLTGRLKRFVKIGGEMISLGGLEEDLIKLTKQNGWATPKGEGPLLAVTAKGLESEKPQIVLFTTFNIDLETVNRTLRETGLGRLAKIAEIHKLSEIPLTGTGKTHYRGLDELVQSYANKTV